MTDGGRHPSWKSLRDSHNAATKRSISTKGFLIDLPSTASFSGGVTRAGGQGSRRATDRFARGEAARSQGRRDARARAQRAIRQAVEPFRASRLPLAAGQIARKRERG